MEKQTLTFRLNISPERYLENYSGMVQDVVARAHDGRVIQFPAVFLRPFVTREGIQGDFMMEYDNNGHCHQIKKIEGTYNGRL